MEGIPWYSTFTLFTEFVVTLGVLHIFYAGYFKNRFPYRLTALVLGYEIVFNISYMVSRLATHVESEVPHEHSALHLAAAIFHGSFALIMFILLLVFMALAWRGYRSGINYFREHSRLTGAFVIAWMIAIASGFFFYYEAYFSPEELLVRETEAALVADYRAVTFTISGKPITLTDGRYEEELVPGAASKRIVKYFGNEAVGDVNGDGVADTAFLVTEEGGGSGTFFYLVGAIKEPQGYRGTAAMYIGDRIAPQTTNYKDGLVIVNYADRAPGEPFSARPSIGKSLYAKYSQATNDFGEVVQGFEGESALPEGTTPGAP